jgi:hypothetical protein
MEGKGSTGEAKRTQKRMEEMEEMAHLLDEGPPVIGMQLSPEKIPVKGPIKKQKVYSLPPGDLSHFRDLPELQDLPGLSDDLQGLQGLQEGLVEPMRYEHGPDDYMGQLYDKGLAKVDKYPIIPLAVDAFSSPPHPPSPPPPSPPPPAPPPPGLSGKVQKRSGVSPRKITANPVFPICSGILADGYTPCTQPGRHGGFCWRHK